MLSWFHQMGQTSQTDGIALSKAERADIDATFAMLETATLYDLLGVERYASGSEIDAAFEIMSLRFRAREGALGAWGQRLDAITSQLVHAHEVLGNPIRRVGYDAVLGAPTESSTTPDPPDGIVISLPEPRVVTGGVFDSLFPADATPSNEVATAPIDPPPVIQRATSRRPAARESRRPAARRSSPPARTSAKPPPRQTVATPARGPKGKSGLDVMEALLKDARKRKLGVPAAAAEVHPKAPEVAPPPPPPVQSAPAAREPSPVSIDAVRKLVTDASEHEKARRWVEASGLWSTAFRAMPGETKLRLRASNAMAQAALAAMRTGDSLPKALTHARAAVAIASDNVNAHTTLAKVFLVGGLRTSARIALQTALSLDPESKTARDLQSEILGR